MPVVESLDEGGPTIGGFDERVHRRVQLGEKRRCSPRATLVIPFASSPCFRNRLGVKLK